MGAARILLVEDDAALARMIKVNMERAGEFAVASAATGREARERADAEAFDLAIVDIGLPDMSGTVVLERLKASHPGLPVVVCSVFYDRQALIDQEAMRRADGLIGKPFEHDQLIATVKSVLAGGRRKPGGIGPGSGDASPTGSSAPPTDRCHGGDASPTGASAP